MAKKWQKLCKKCKHHSYSLKINNVCPYCCPEYIVERIKNKICDADFDNFFSKYCKKYKININEEETKNRLISLAMFEQDKKIKKALINFCKHKIGSYNPNEDKRG